MGRAIVAIGLVLAAASWAWGQPAPAPEELDLAVETLAAEESVDVLRDIARRTDAMALSAEGERAAVVDAVAAIVSTASRVNDKVKTGVAFLSGALEASGLEQEYAAITSVWAEADFRSFYDRVRPVFDLVGLGTLTAALLVESADLPEDRQAVLGLSVAAAVSLSVPRLLELFGIGDVVAKANDYVQTIEISRNAYDQLILRRKLVEGYRGPVDELLDDINANLAELEVLESRVADDGIDAQVLETLSALIEKTALLATRYGEVSPLIDEYNRQFLDGIEFYRATYSALDLSRFARVEDQADRLQRTYHERIAPYSVDRVPQLVTRLQALRSLLSPG